MAETTPRAEAKRSLLRFERSGKYINLELDASLSRMSGGLSPADRALYAALVYGTVERTLTLDGEIAHYTSRDAGALDPETRAALRLGLYQILFMDKIPPHAAVNETVATSPARSRGLVNAVLRRCLREGARLHPPTADESSAEYLSYIHSVPKGIVEAWIADYGADDAAGLCAAANRRPCATLRVNTLLTDAGTLSREFENAGVAATPNARFPDDMIDVGAGVSIGKLYGYGEGLWFVQDAASRCAVTAAGIMPGYSVVDVCAAPGGKSFSAALDMRGQGEIRSFDLHENKLGLIRRGAERLGIGIITAGARDGRDPDPALCGRADVTLCDVPCSGLGVIAKKPDIRYKDLKDIDRLPEVQSAILSASASYVKPGGVLVYSTCTLRRAENDDVASGFLASHPEFETVPFSAAGIDAPDGSLTLMPHKHGTDGFYIAKFRRKK